MGRQACQFKGCGKKKCDYPELSFFTFPVKNSKQCIQWLENSAVDEKIRQEFDNEEGRKTLGHRVICSLHFLRNCFQNETKKILNKHNDKLQVVPTVISEKEEKLAEISNKIKERLLNGDYRIIDRLKDPNTENNEDVLLLPDATTTNVALKGDENKKQQEDDSL
jgi:hypothetical protein